MSRKKLDVVELNKKEEQIVLEESKSALALFFKKYRKVMFLVLLLLALILVVGGSILLAKYIKNSTDPTITKITLDTPGIETTNISISSDYTLTNEAAINSFNNGPFKRSGESILVKKVEGPNYIINYYSDGIAIKINNDGRITKINSLSNGEYGISEEGIISTKAVVRDISIKKETNYPWGNVTYFSDGSAIITNDGIEIYVRNSEDINKEYISKNKISYLKETKTIGSNKVNYYYDGTIEVIKNGVNYLVRNKDDIKISGNNITFPNNNEAYVIKEQSLSDGNKIIYYSDGGAIIIDKDGNRISVRKSNSIIIENNKIKEINDNIYVDLVSQKGNTKYYSNGSGITEYKNETVYVEDNSNIKYNENKQINNITSDYEKLAKKLNDEETTVLMFETVAYVENKDFKAIVPRDTVIFNSDGTFKEILESKIENSGNNFSITNNTNKSVKYRIVIEKSDKSNLNEEYIRYQLSAKDKYVEPTKLNKLKWTDKALASKLSAKGINFILLEDNIEPYETIDVNLMLWTDYETIPNAMQNKVFLGTVKVYSWTEK